jgi:hypothetical protein
MAGFAVTTAELRAGFSALGEALENAVLRRVLSTTREIADLRIRVERLEKECGQLPQ